MSVNIPVISFVGYSGSGKTTFIEKLIPELKKRNIRLAVVKHDAHKFSIDKEGKDTYRFAEAGADIVSISSSEKIAIIEKTNKELVLEDIIKKIRNVDLIITEGYRAGGAPKIGVYRKASGKDLSVNINELMAIITDIKNESNIPTFGIEDIKGVANFIEENFIKSKYPTWLSLNEAKEMLLNLPLELDSEYVSLEKANQRILAEEIIAREMIPPFSKSAFDGYAIRAKDSIYASVDNPVTLQLTEEIPAGKQPVFAVDKGTAAKILTGAPIPEGADVVIKYEDTRYDETSVTILKQYRSNTNIVYAGEDIATGEIVSKKGIIITPPIAGLLASLGISSPLVYKKPVISIVNTGDELLYVNEPLVPAKIRNSSHYTISAYLEQLGISTLDGGTAKDEVNEIAKYIKLALSHSDMIITTGGVSVGDYDLVRVALDLLGAKTLFWKINIKPGSAVVAATLDNKLILGLSGNPASAILTLHLLGIPYINKLLGKESVELKKIKVCMKEAFNKKSQTTRYLRGKLIIEEGIANFEQIENTGNGAISSLKNCDLIGEIKAGTLSLNKGDIIDAYWLNA